MDKHYESFLDSSSAKPQTVNDTIWTLTSNAILAQSTI